MSNDRRISLGDGFKVDYGMFGDLLGIVEVTVRLPVTSDLEPLWQVMGV